MTWIENLLFTTESVAHTVFLYAFVIALGVYLGKIKFFGISLGVTFVLLSPGISDLSERRISCTFCRSSDLFFSFIPSVYRWDPDFSRLSKKEVCD